MKSDFSQKEADLLEAKNIPMNLKKAVIFNKINSSVKKITRTDQVAKLVGHNRKRNTKMIAYANKNFSNKRVSLEDLSVIYKTAVK